MVSRLDRVERELGQPLPHVVRDLYEQGDGRFDSEAQWWVIWPLDRLVSENAGAWSRGLPETYLAFGDDGTGNPFCIERAGESLEVKRWNWIDGDFEGVEGSFDDFLDEWVNDPR